MKDDTVRMIMKVWGVVKLCALPVVAIYFWRKVDPSISVESFLSGGFAFLGTLYASERGLNKIQHAIQVRRNLREGGYRR